MKTASSHLIEHSLREQFNTRKVEFSHAALDLKIILPRAADELLDEEAFAKDERMPYWADLWPSARGLARFLLDHPIHIESKVIELGCGLALPSLALRSKNIDVLATDHNEDGLMFARANAQRNGLGELPVQLLDWRDLKALTKRFDIAIASDVLYEQRNASALIDLLSRNLKPEGKFILADPGRRWAGEFRRRMRQAGWIETELAMMEEEALGAGAPSTIEITQWSMRSHFSEIV